MAAQRRITGREREMDAAYEAVRNGAGAYLVGRAGVGKSRIAEAVADCASHDNYEVIRVRATASSSELPLGVFLTIAGATERFLTPMITEIRDRIQERAAGRRVVLAVDDIDRLDDSSAVLIHQMVSSGEAALLATLRLGRIAPGEITDLWHRGELQRIEVGPFDPAGSVALAEAVLGRALDPASHERLWAVTHGNALFIREVLLSAQEAGLLVDTPTGCSLADIPVQSPRLIDSVRSRLAAVDARLHDALVHLAFAEPCGPAELTSVATAADLAALEAAELITSQLDGQRLSLSLSHPLYGEVLRGGTPLLQRRAVLATLARDLQATGARRRPDVVKLARLAVDGGVDIDPALLVRAASLTYHNGDLVLCERIGRRAFELSSRFDAGRELANCLYQAGELAAFREHLQAWRACVSTTAERLATSMLETQTEFWYGGDMARCVAVTDEALAAAEGLSADELAGDGSTPDELLANIALFHTLSGNPARGWELAEPLLERGPDVVLIRAALAAANALGHLGRVDDAVAVLDRAVDAYGVIGSEATSLSLRTVMSVRAIGNLWRGDMARAWADTNGALTNAVSEFQISAANLVAGLLGAFNGRPNEARKYVERAYNWWGRSTGGSSERRWVLARMALVYSTAGDIEATRRVLTDFDADDSPGIVFDFEAELGRARMLSAEGFLEDARVGLRQAMLAYRERGFRVGEATCAYEMVRMHHADEVAPRLAELGAQMQGSLFPTMAQHATALVSNDASGLGEVCERFAQMDMNLYASEAAAQASDAAKQRGDQRAAARWLNRAAELRALCEVVSTHTPLVDVGPVALTRREREIAMLAAQGLASKEIGERLFISRRTAENHLAKVYDKLGVRTRSELARVFDGGTAALAS